MHDSGICIVVILPDERWSELCRYFGSRSDTSLSRLSSGDDVREVTGLVISSNSASFMESSGDSDRGERLRFVVATIDSRKF